MLSRPCPLALQGHGKDIKRATLVVTPETILQQWLADTQRHAELNVAVYEGSSDISTLADVNDIVFTTYTTMQKDFRRRSKALRNCKWWRVVLDEAQVRASKLHGLVLPLHPTDCT